MFVFGNAVFICYLRKILQYALSESKSEHFCNLFHCLITNIR